MACDLTNLGAELLDVVDRNGAFIVLALDQHDHRGIFEPGKPGLDGDIEHNVIVSIAGEVLVLAMDRAELGREEKPAGLELTGQVFEHLLLKELAFGIRAEFWGFADWGCHSALKTYATA